MSVTNSESPYQGFWYFARSRSRKIQVNPRNPAKFTKPAKFGRNVIKYMSIQHIWNLFQLLGLFTCRKLATLSWNFVTETCKQLPGVDYVAKNWTLAVMLKALPLVYFRSVLLLKERMMTSVRRTWKTLFWSAQNRSISSEICLKSNHKIGRFLPITFWWVCPENSREIPAKTADFSANFSLKIPRNLTFSSAIYLKPCLKKWAWKMIRNI